MGLGLWDPWYYIPRPKNKSWQKPLIAPSDLGSDVSRRTVSVCLYCAPCTRRGCGKSGTLQPKKISSPDCESYMKSEAQALNRTLDSKPRTLYEPFPISPNPFKSLNPTATLGPRWFKFRCRVNNRFRAHTQKRSTTVRSCWG